MIHPAVVVLVFENDDPAERLARISAGGVGHEAEHLDDPHAAFEIEIDGDRIDDHRLAGDELERDSPAARWKVFRSSSGVSVGETAATFCTGGGQARVWRPAIAS